MTTGMRKSAVGRPPLEPRPRRSEDTRSRARKTRARERGRHALAQRKQEERVDASDYDTQQNQTRQDGGEMRARCIPDSTPSNNGGFGTDITHRGVARRERKCGTGDVSGDAPRSPKGKAGRLESDHGNPEGEKPARKRSYGLDVSGVVCGAEGEPCTILNPVLVYGE